MKTKRRTYPGSIYADRGRLYIKFKGQRIATGLLDNKLGHSRADELLQKMWEDYHHLGESSMRKSIMINDAFKEFKASKVSRMEKTIQGYDSAFNKIIRTNYYLSEDKIEKDIQYYLKTTDNSPITKNIYLRDLQTFLNFCTKKNWLPATDFKNQYKVKTQKVENSPYTLEELTKILRYMNKKNRQLYLMIQLMLATGARLVDCLTLYWDQVNEDEVTWNNKITKDPEVVPISQSARIILRQIKKLNPQSPKVFTWTRSGSSFLHKELREAFKYIDVLRKERAFQEFRVTFRMSLIGKGLPMPLEMRLMRHHDYKVTDRKYTKIEKEMLLNYLEKKQ